MGLFLFIKYNMVLDQRNSYTCTVHQNIIGLVGTCVIGLALFTYTVGELISVNAIDNLDTHAFNMEIK